MGLSKLLEEPPFLSFKELKNAGVRRVIYTPAAERLYWEFDGVFPTSTAISIMKNEKGAKDDLEPFFNPDTGTWHEISQLPLTEPKTSSFEVSVFDLEGRRWERDWDEWHKYHQDSQRYESTEDSGAEVLIKCCGEDRPFRKPLPVDVKLVVTAGSEGFITVRDFVSAVHPWLMSLRGDLFKAKDVSRERPYYGSSPEEDKWMVGLPINGHCSQPLEIEEKREWVRRHSPYERRPGDPPMKPALREAGLDTTW
ncbi:hypothetical protein B0T09DRAFT_302981 [Sordaria sp. MPI-SDFR-AT-0083]|nr:hypothetical protein B0T09DRAFT_302981 [Sordaria sp. MPI-SDFR-AT-0083]